MPVFTRLKVTGRAGSPRLAATAVAVTTLALVLPFGVGTAAAEDLPVTVSGVLHQGTPAQVVYQAIKPTQWNGTLILDLDFNSWNQARRDYFLNQGYAIGGNQRTQNETAYEIKDYVDNLVRTRELLIDAVETATGDEGEPARTIAWGNSRGAFVSRMAAQYRPDIFDGALGSAGGGAGVIASWLSKADAVWALQQLVNPAAGLAINDLPDIAPGATYGPTYDQDVKLGALVTAARASDQGLARLVLAAAFEQATDFPSGTQPPADEDYLTQGQLIGSGFAFGNPQFVHKEIEVMGGGPVVWNHGIDYRAILEASGDKDRVEWWYQHAGLDLEADLNKLAAAPRYGADPAAVETVEGIGTYDGTGSPVLTIKTLGRLRGPGSTGRGLPPDVRGVRQCRHPLADSPHRATRPRGAELRRDARGAGCPRGATGLRRLVRRHARSDERSRGRARDELWPAGICLRRWRRGPVHPVRRPSAGRSHMGLHELGDLRA